MESAELPVKVLHDNVGKSLKELGHYTVSTIPPNEGPVFAEDLKGMIEDVKYNANSALEQAVSGGVTNVRTTTGHKGFSIARAKEVLRRKLNLWK